MLEESTLPPSQLLNANRSTHVTHHVIHFFLSLFMNSHNIMKCTLFFSFVEISVIISFALNPLEKKVYLLSDEKSVVNTIEWIKL